MKTITMHIPDFAPVAEVTRKVELQAEAQAEKIKEISMGIGTSIPEQIGTYLVELFKPVWDEPTRERIRYIGGNYFKGMTDEYFIVSFASTYDSLTLYVYKDWYRWNCNVQNTERIVQICGKWPDVKRQVKDGLSKYYDFRRHNAESKVTTEQARLEVIMKFKI